MTILTSSSWRIIKIVIFEDRRTHSEVQSWEQHEGNMNGAKDQDTLEENLKKQKLGRFLVSEKEDEDLAWPS